MKSLFSKCSKLFVIGVIFLFSNTFAQNANDALRLGIPGLGSDARALGMGDSYIGLSDGSGAAFFNPAGWGLLKRLELSGGLSYNNFGNNTTFLGQYSDYSNSSTKLTNLSFAFPFPTLRGSLVFAVSYHTNKLLDRALKFNGFNNSSSMIDNMNQSSNIPYDLYLTDNNYNTPLVNNLNQSGSILSDGALNNWTFSGAIEAYKNLYLGLNLNIITGSFNNNNDYYEDDTKGYYANIETDPGNTDSRGFQTFHLNRILNWDISGWDAKFGMLYQISPQARFGLTVQFPKTYTVKEKFDVSGSSSFANGTSYTLDGTKYSDQVQYDIVTPFELGGGLSVNFVGLIVSGQATLIDYSQLKFSNADGLSAEYVAQTNKDIKDQLKSVFNYNFGAEYTFPVLGVRLRAGYIVQPSAYQGDPSDFDHKYYTAGFGFLADGAVGIDLAYAHGSWKTYGDNYGTNLSRTYQDIKVDRFILTTTYRF